MTETDAAQVPTSTNPYETDLDKIPEGDPYLARSPHYGRYHPRPDDFTPQYNYWYQSEAESTAYWKDVVGKYCTPENSIQTVGGREVFVAGAVVIRVDKDDATGAAEERYSCLNANELGAARKAEESLKDLGIAVPVIYFCGTVEEKNVTVESRIPGVSLDVAWRYLTAEQRRSFKEQSRNVIKSLQMADSSSDEPSYVCRGLNHQTPAGTHQRERDILFEESKKDEDFCLVHNDMVRSNMVVKDDKIVGIIGWRQCGYFGLDRAARVHRELRTPESSYIVGPGEDDGEKSSWADLYEFPSEDNGKKTLANGHGNPTPEVKLEAEGSSLDAVPSAAVDGIKPSISQLDGTDFPAEHPTPKKVTDLKRGSMSRASSSERSSPIPATKGSAAAKKPTAASSKKGTATKKAAPKKRKLNAQDGDSVDGRSNTPASSRASKTPAPKKQGSASAAGSPAPESKKKRPKKAAPESDDESVEDANEIFCICRRPDNHTWMIGCDGGCEDWFHGRCVNIDPRDADLIDKYICPNCEEQGKRNTTWKPMCRLPECRKPARITKQVLSKYCSDEHGREFMRLKTQQLNLVRAPGSASNNSRSTSHTRKGNKSQRSNGHVGELDPETSHAEDGAASNDEDDDYDMDADVKNGAEELGSRGGILTARELKAAISGVSSVEEFRRLGDRIVSPPDDEVKDDGKKKLGLDIDPKDLTYTPDEETKIQKLRKRRDELLHRKDMLRARNTFLGLVRQRGKHVLERLKQTDPKGGWKDICGFDTRLSWSDEEFDEWRLSEAGQKALKDGNLEAIPAKDADGDTPMEDASNQENDIDTISRGVCLKKRCERHKQWVKVQQQDIQFEEAMAAQDLAKCEQEAQAVVERAVLRMWAEKDGSS
ncbi:PHD transcription factor, putative [Paecilomyces variotii No. 5]|uniref:PHD transcription factor, putative n=1 Tax=Byssochlamys spectabilis (strain No. 5 / NBRC 109023) TaxID=1356009 RepID=V5HX40_BYSSN|nr:PHD transcription factor, putative [Paecilomyces variotii No. 5]